MNLFRHARIFFNGYPGLYELNQYFGFWLFSKEKNVSKKIFNF